MKQKRINWSFLIIATIAVIVSSCQKEYAPGEVLDPVVTDSTDTIAHRDSSYLDKVYSVDSIGGIIDTTGKQIYFYDAQKRVINVKDSVIYDGTWRLAHATAYFYNGVDTLPFKTITNDYDAAITYNSPNTVDTLTKFFRYDATSRTIYDSSYEVQYENSPGLTLNLKRTINNYQYSANKIYGDSRYEFIEPVSSPGYARDTAQLDTRGNVISAKQYGEITGVWTVFLNSEFTYDDHPSPYSKLSIFRSIGVLPFGETFIDEMQSRNNRLKAFEQYVGGNDPFDEDLTGRYQYYPNGYPSRIKQQDDITPTDAHITIFTYRSL